MARLMFLRCLHPDDDFLASFFFVVWHGELKGVRLFPAMESTGTHPSIEPFPVHQSSPRVNLLDGGREAYRVGRWDRLLLSTRTKDIH